jgi:hypothetical protein
VADPNFRQRVARIERIEMRAPVGRAEIAHRFKRPIRTPESGGAFSAKHVSRFTFAARTQA